LDHYLPWNDALAEEWLAALFLRDRPRVRDVTEGASQPNTDLVWVGRAANYAAKLSALPDSHPTYITKEVYDVMNAEVKTGHDGSTGFCVGWFELLFVGAAHYEFRRRRIPDGRVLARLAEPPAGMVSAPRGASIRQAMA
jgi:hypothetical protein